MKTFSKIILVMSLLIFLLVMIKPAGIIGMGILLVLVASTLSILSFIWVIMALVKFRFTLFKTAGAVLGLAFSFSSIGVLFYYMFWPGAAVMGQAGLFFLIIGSIIALYGYSKKPDEEEKAGTHEVLDFPSEQKTAFPEKRTFLVGFMIPVIPFLILLAIPYILSGESFYNTFSAMSKTKSYQEFRQERTIPR